MLYEQVGLMKITFNFWLRRNEIFINRSILLILVVGLAMLD